MQKIKNRFGFTVLEVIIVIAIIGILLTIGTVTYTGYQARTRDTTREANAKIIANALELYYNKNGEYPNVGTMIGSTPEKAALLARTIQVDQKVLLTPKAPTSTVNSIANFDTTPDNTEADVYRYEGISGGDAAYSDCKVEGVTDYGKRPYTPILSSASLAVVETKPRCKAFKLSFKHEASSTWKYINSINN